MTKEEAIQELQNCKELIQQAGQDYLDERDIPLLDMAIKSLSEDEVVRCKDCIHRQTDKCPMYHEEWYTIDEGDGYFSDDWDVYDYTVDDGYCHLGDTEVEQTEQQTEEEMLREQCQAFIDIVNHTEKVR